MFKVDVRGQLFALKSMNCPGHMLLFGSRPRSYKELPLRYSEAASLHRDELPGTLHGLLRVRIVTQDDAHIFCTEEQIQDEIASCVEQARYLYELFGLKASAEFGTRPDNKIGTDEQWDRTEAAIEEALRLNEIPYTIAPGEGAFYGPKIDLHMDGRPRPQVADGDDPARLADALALRAQVRGRRQRRARPVRRAPRAVRLVRALHRHPHRALRRRLPVLARTRAGAGAACAGGPPRGGRRDRGEARRRPASAPRSTSGTRRSASGSARPSWRRSRT